MNIKRNSTLVDDDLHIHILPALLQRCFCKSNCNLILCKFTRSDAVTTISYFTPLLFYGGIIQLEELVVIQISR